MSLFFTCCCAYLFIGLLICNALSKQLNEMVADLAKKQGCSERIARISAMVIIVLFWPEAIYHVFIKR